MKKNIAVLLLAVLFSWTSVDAASLCSYEKQSDITKQATNVKITYEEARGELDPSTYLTPEGEDPDTYVAYYDYFKIKILNITEDIYVKLENSSNDEVKYIEYKDTDEGTFTIDWKDLSQTTTFNYTVYSSSNTDCPNENYRTGVMTTRMLNDNYNNILCTDYPEFYLCQKYISTSVSEEKFNELIKSYIEKNKEEKEEQIKKEEEDKKNNKLIIIIATSIIIVGGGVAIVIAKKKRGSRVI